MGDTALVQSARSTIQPYLESLLKRFGNLRIKSIIIALLSSLVGTAALAGYCYYIEQLSSDYLLYVLGSWIVSATIIYYVLSNIRQHLLPELSLLVRSNFYERKMLQALLDDEFQAAMIMKRFPGLFKHRAINPKTLTERAFKHQLDLFINTMYYYLCIYFRCKFLPLPYDILFRLSIGSAWMALLVHSINTLAVWMNPATFWCLQLAIAAFAIPYGLMITACVRYCLVDALYEAYFGDETTD